MRGSRVIGRIMIAALALLGATATIEAGVIAPPGTDSMAEGPRMKAPRGHREFCLSHPSECLPLEEAEPMSMSPRDWETAWTVNREVNHGIEAKTDQEALGVEERWDYPGAVGDCEDFALLKRRRLIEAGFDPSNLLLTLVRMRDGSGHAVLSLRTISGDYVLDNLDDRILPWRRAPYAFLQRQSAADAADWLSIENGDASWARNVGVGDRDTAGQD